MKRLIILIFMLLTSCGTYQKSINEEFLEYTKRFVTYTQMEVDLPITFSKLDGHVGVCITYTNGKKEIEIDREYWEIIGDLAKEQLIFHELGHCVLNRNHDETLIKLDGYYYTVPKSIMYPFIFGEQEFYFEYHDYYLEELLDPDKRL